LGRHLDVEPRIDAALHLNQRYQLHAGIDCSDGLSLDLWRLCQASGCGAVVDVNRIPIAAAAQQLVQQKKNVLSPLEHALSDGEDFELILAVPSDSARKMIANQPLEDTLLTDIGQFISDRVFLQSDAAGNKQKLLPTGYLHGFE
jgi:thiamine-monophosphate kinase